jgi:hypothetical protein
VSADGWSIFVRPQHGSTRLVSVVLDRNIDAIVVDEEKIAIDCIEVSILLPPIPSQSTDLDDST